MTADALVDAEAQGLSSHGIARMAQYATHLRNGRADGNAVAASSHASAAAPCWSMRAADLRSPRVRWPSAKPIRRAREFGVSFAGVTNSHHFGVAAWHLRTRCAGAAWSGLAFGNSPAAMPAAGGRRALFGTNPIAAVFPRRDDAAVDDRPFAVRSGARQGDGRGEGGTADSARLGARCATASRRPTRRPRLQGSMLAMGGTKGAMLALVVELLVTALTGAAMGFEASSFFVDEGNRPRIGQAFLVIDPDALAGKQRLLRARRDARQRDARRRRRPAARASGATALARARRDGGRRDRARARCSSCRRSPRRDGRRTRSRGATACCARCAPDIARCCAPRTSRDCWSRYATCWSTKAATPSSGSATPSTTQRSRSDRSRMRDAKRRSFAATALFVGCGATERHRAKRSAPASRCDRPRMPAAIRCSTRWRTHADARRRRRDRRFSAADRSTRSSAA